VYLSSSIYRLPDLTGTIVGDAWRHVSDSCEVLLCRGRTGDLAAVERHIHPV
jgi:hypothetical protein